MKKKNKLTLAISIVVSILVLASVIIAASTIANISDSAEYNKAQEIISYLVGKGEMPEDADVNSDGKVDVFDALILFKQAIAEKSYVTYINLDDQEYSFDFNREILEYTVQIPEGHPTVPQVSAKSIEGIDIEVRQAYLPDNATSGTAYVVATNQNGKSTTYTITFEKSSSVGFKLQYDDRYTFVPDHTLAEGESFTFSSSDATKVSVDENGLMIAKKVTSVPVTITATAGDYTETLTVDEVEKAHINLFLITGQSNTQGCYSNTTQKDAEKNAAQLANVEKIGRDGAVYSYDFHPIKTNTEVYNLRYTLYDMNTVSKQGFQNSLGKKWYELTGEKVVFLQTAYSGAPIQSWLDTETQPEAGKYAGRNFYDDTQQAYANLIPLLYDNYEIIRTANFWCQGGTAMQYIYDHELGDYIQPSQEGFDASKLMTDEQYYDLFMRLHNDMKRDFGIEYCGILLNRVQSGAASAESKALQLHTDMVPIRSAQYSLHNTVADVSLVSRVGDFARKLDSTDTTSYGYGFIDTDNTHYTQIGYNERGRVAAETAFNVWFSITSETGVEIISENGRDRLTSADTIELKEGAEYRLAGYALPMNSGAKTTLSSSNPSVATVDKYGVVTAVSAGNAVITATTENGKTESVNIKVYKVIYENVTYRWDFDTLEATGRANTLTLSDGAVETGAKGKYTLTDGVYATVSNVGSYNRPDFTLDVPVTLTSENSWSIEWCGITSTTCTLLGPAQTDFTSTTTVNGFIYNGFTADFGGGVYPLRWQPAKGSQLLLPFGDYKELNRNMNAWKLAYDAETNMMTLYSLDEDKVTWHTVSSLAAGEFETTFYTMFGRMKGTGQYNFKGQIDYVQIDYVQESKVETHNYDWQLSDLTSSADKNDLTVSAGTIYNQAENNYTLINGVYQLTSNISTYTRPDFTLEKPLNLTSQDDWVIEWQGLFSSSSVLFGPQHTDHEGDVTVNGFIYNGYLSKFGTSDNPVYPLRWQPAVGKEVLLPFGTYKNSNKTTNAWRLSYEAKTNMLTLSFYDKTESTWVTVSSLPAGSFETTFYTLFGRMRGNGYLNFKGEMDYVKVSILDREIK